MTLQAQTELIGRDEDLVLLHAELRRAIDGAPRFAVIEGPAGIGKTHLLRCFLNDAPDARLIRISCVETEADLDFGVVDLLLRQADAEPHLRANTPHKQAGLAVLTALGTLEAACPVVLAVDDAHWADPASLQALLFSIRRLTSERVLTVFAVRTDERLPRGFREFASDTTGVTIRLGPLSAEGVQALAVDAGTQLSLRAAQQLRDHTDGHPLYLSALLAEFPVERWDGAQYDWPAPESYAALIGTRVAALSPASRRVLEVVAVLGDLGPLATVLAICGPGAELSAVEAAVESGLLKHGEREGVGTLSFDHPLTRAAVYHALSITTRSQLHARCAETLDDPALVLRHRVGASIGPDAALADDLDRFARTAREHGAWATAADALNGASQLSTDVELRKRRLLEAAEAALYGSDLAYAQRMLPAVRRLEPSAQRDGVLAFASIALGERKAAADLLESAWTQCDAQRPILAAQLAERRAWFSTLALLPQEVERWGRTAIAFAPDNDPTVPLSTRTLVFAVDQLGRGEEAMELLEHSAARLGPRLRRGGFSLGDARGTLLLAADRVQEALPELLNSARLELDHDLITQASCTYAQAARAEYLLGRWDDAVVHAELATALADDISDPGPQAVARQAAVLVPAARGDEDALLRLRDELAALPLVFPSHEAARRIGLARAEAALGNPETVVTHLQPLWTDGTGGGAFDPGYWRWHDLFVFALLDAGHHLEAGRFLAACEAAVARQRRPSMQAALAIARGRLAWMQRRGDESLRAFTEARARIERLPLPFEKARIDLEHGQVLRRDGQRRAAAHRLTAAKEQLDALGAAPLQRRCDDELDASGLKPVRRCDDDAGTRLTPRERAIAQLAARGLTNRKIAAELMLSLKTVENHLTRVFAKRGLHSRAELKADLEADPR